MGHYMDATVWQMMSANTFIFDLEYIGTTSDLNTCFIWEIGVIHYLTGNSFSITISPDIHPLPPPFSDDYIQLTPTILKDRNAVDFATAWTKLIHWINTILISANQNILWIAHNAFKADKPMLEIDTRRHGIIMPYNWFFLDSLIYCRQSIVKQQSYTLGDLYYILFGKNIPGVHSALPDAQALRDILITIDQYSISGPIYPSYATSLQAIKWLGPSSEKKLFSKNIQSLEQLTTVLMTAYSTYSILGNIIPIRTFINDYLISVIGLKSGNAHSISDSITNNWLPGTK